MVSRRGPNLPYSVIAGATPSRNGWFVASAKLSGATFIPEIPRHYASFNEILNERPAFSVVVMDAPIGYRDSSASPERVCEIEARNLLGNRARFIRRAPLRSSLTTGVSSPGENLDAVTAFLLPLYGEIGEEMTSHRQRVVYAGSPELSFFQLNGDTPMTSASTMHERNAMRRDLLIKRLPMITKILDEHIDGVNDRQKVDAAALLWTARRVVAHVAIRLPSLAIWDDASLRMELVF
jgi:predicted RNase H-like nuclease